MIRITSRTRHHMRWLALVLATLATLLPRGAARAQSDVSVHLCDTPSGFPTIEFCVRVRDAAGRDVLSLGPGQIQVIEDGAAGPPVAELRLRDAREADAAGNLAMRDGLVEPLYDTGATLGVVFDMPAVLGAERVGLARQATEQFLLQAGGLAPFNPEAIGLYLPIAQPDEQVMPAITGADPDGFTQDANAVINHLRTMQPRAGKATSLYAAIQRAVEDTTRVAQRRGSAAAVLVVSDGGDRISGETFNAIIGRANGVGVRIVAFDYRNDGSFQLNQLAGSTDGAYRQRPDDAAARDAFAQVVAATPAGLYSVRYKTALRNDGRPHRFAIRVTLPEGEATSETVEVSFDQPEVTPFPPLWSVLLRQYLLIALPVLLLASLLLVLITGGVRWSRGLSLDRDITRR